MLKMGILLEILQSVFNQGVNGGGEPLNFVQGYFSHLVSILSSIPTPPHKNLLGVIERK